MEQEVLQKIQNIMGPEFELEQIYQRQKTMVFRAEDQDVSDEHLSRIIFEIMSSGFFPRVHKRNGKIFVMVLPRTGEKKRVSVWINILLFLLTILSTMMAGSYLLGKSYLVDISNITAGWRYSMAIMLILTAHEMGHYLAARFHGMQVTLPYYIPLPIPGMLHFGTAGAFIKIRSPIPSRPALLDVGAAGPLSGLIVSLFFLVLGYWRLPDLPGIIQYVSAIHPWDMGNEGLNIVLGKSVLFSFFNDFLAGGRLPMNEIYHFPFIFAGWIGLLVTAINLIPIGQLDGGHILYALVRRNARSAGIISFLLFLVLNFVLIFRYFSFVWVIWIVLILMLIGFRHPPTVREDIPLTRGRRLAGWVSLALFAVCFTPLPIYIQG